jgi:hypothetical protein
VRQTADHWPLSLSNRLAVKAATRGVSSPTE